MECRMDPSIDSESLAIRPNEAINMSAQGNALGWKFTWAIEP